jgi:hypothetical protein
MFPPAGENAAVVRIEKTTVRIRRIVPAVTPNDVAPGPGTPSRIAIIVRSVSAAAGMAAENRITTWTGCTIC